MNGNNMYRQISSEEATGKTVKSVAQCFASEQLLIVFESQNFLCFKAKLDSTGEMAELVEADLDLDSFNREKLIEHGIITKEESEQMDRRKEEEWRKEKEETERREYERLKRKFEEG